MVAGQVARGLPNGPVEVVQIGGYCVRGNSRGDERAGYRLGRVAVNSGTQAGAGEDRLKLTWVPGQVLLAQSSSSRSPPFYSDQRLRSHGPRAIRRVDSFPSQATIHQRG